MRCKIINIIRETSDVISIIIKPQEEFNYIAGQFIMVSIPNLKKDNKVIERAFSIASAPHEKYIRLTIKLKQDGVFTKHVFNKLKINDYLNIRGPYGHFILKNEKEIVLIGGGTGIAPLRSLLLSSIKNENKITLIYSTKNEIIYENELDVLSKNKDIKIKIIKTNPDKDWIGETERINEEILKKYINNKKRFFICGPKEMVINSRKDLINLGIKKEKISIESW